MSRPRSALFALLLFGCATAPLPKRALELNDAGAEALAEGDLETAAARLSVALEYSPRFVEALVNLGLVECQRGNFARARQLLLRARRLNPDVAQPHHALGVLAERVRRPDLASEDYLEALRVDPGFAASRANLGRLQFDAGQLDAASLTFRKLMEVAPDRAEGYIGLAETLTRLGRTDEADSVTRLAFDKFPDAPGAVLLAGRARLHRAEYEAARALFARLTGRADDFGAAALAWLAATELAERRFADAETNARRALSLLPDDALACHVLSAALAALGKPGAAAWAERAQRLGAP